MQQWPFTALTPEMFPIWSFTEKRSRSLQVEATEVNEWRHRMGDVRASLRAGRSVVTSRFLSSHTRSLRVTRAAVCGLFPGGPGWRLSLLPSRHPAILDALISSFKEQHGDQKTRVLLRKTKQTNKTP